MATAAAEAPRSSSSGGGAGGGSADSYIGSLISLTSKSEIRYEGVLYNIDTQESTIGLQNVRSFGTEGRKKDGPQVPPSDKIYEYILFRGSDIKDLQVKSSPPVQTATPLHNDPAIIQSHYPQAATTSTGLSSGSGSLTDPGAHSSSLPQPRPIYEGTIPPYQTGGSLGSWGSSPAPPATNGTGLAMPMYWPGYYGPSGGIQAQQHTLLRTPIGLSMPSSMQQPMQYPAADALNFSASQLSENPPLLLPPFSTGAANVQPSLLSAPSSAIFSEPANTIPEKSSVQTLSATSLTSNMPAASTLTATSDRSAIASLGSDKSKSVPDPMMPSKSMPEPPSSITGISSAVLKEAATAPLVTPGQFLQPATTMVPLSHSSQTDQKDVEVVQVTSQQSLTTSMAATQAQEPILPLPSPPERKFYRGSTHTYHGSRGGRERGRGNEISRSATRFTEDFDFTAMNEKFNKDEVWGHLGKSNRVQEDGGNSHDEDDIGPSKPEPVYVKDDFFDSLSCDALNGGRRNGRGRISEQFKRDSETFGEFSRHRGGRGGWGPGRGGRSHGGGYHGRGSYGYVGRGRGYNMSSRAP